MMDRADRARTLGSVARLRWARLRSLLGGEVSARAQWRVAIHEKRTISRYLDLSAGVEAVEDVARAAEGEGVGPQPIDGEGSAARLGSRGSVEHEKVSK